MSLRSTIAAFLTASAFAGAITVGSCYRQRNEELEKLVSELKLPKEEIKPYFRAGIPSDWIDEALEKKITPELWRTLVKKGYTDPEKNLKTLKNPWLNGPQALKWCNAGLNNSEAYTMHFYDVTNLTDAVEIKEALGEVPEFDILYDHKIPPSEFIPWLKQGKTPTEVAEAYCQELFGDASESSQGKRLKYIQWGITSQIDMNMMKDAGIYPAYLEMMHELMSTKQIIGHVRDGIISDKAIKEWQEDCDITLRQISYCIVKGYTKEQAAAWKGMHLTIEDMDFCLSRGYSLEQSVPWARALFSKEDMDFCLGGRTNKNDILEQMLPAPTYTLEQAMEWKYQGFTVQQMDKALRSDITLQDMVKERVKYEILTKK